jgi:cytochrome c oxidase cbb3-type subunit 3
LGGIGKKYAPVELQSRFLYPRRAVATVTVRTRAGEQFEGALQHVDEFDLEMTDKAGWHHSWPRNDVQYTVHDPLVRHRELLGKYTDADMHNMFAYLETLQ